MRKDTDSKLFETKGTLVDYDEKNQLIKTEKYNSKGELTKSDHVDLNDMMTAINKFCKTHKNEEIEFKCSFKRDIEQ